ncbi:MAG: hypothetical protein ACKOPS_22680, partial [Cyanobium sp.]
MAELPPLTRRRLLRLGASTGLGLAALQLSGCTPTGPRLLASRGDLPSAWSSLLPRVWRVELLDDPAAVLARLHSPANDTGSAAPRPALVQLGDGWAASLPPQTQEPLGILGHQCQIHPRRGGQHKPPLQAGIKQQIPALFLAAAPRPTGRGGL